MHIHRRRHLQPPTHKSARRSSRKHQPLRPHPLPRPIHPAYRSSPRLRNRPQCLLHNIRQPTLFIPRRRIRTPIHATTPQVGVIPIHLSNQIPRHLLIRRTSRQQINRIPYLRHLREHHRSPRAPPPPPKKPPPPHTAAPPPDQPPASSRAAEHSTAPAEPRPSP